MNVWGLGGVRLRIVLPQSCTLRTYSALIVAGAVTRAPWMCGVWGPSSGSCCRGSSTWARPQSHTSRYEEGSTVRWWQWLFRLLGPPMVCRKGMAPSVSQPHFPWIALRRVLPFSPPLECTRHASQMFSVTNAPPPSLLAHSLRWLWFRHQERPPSPSSPMQLTQPAPQVTPVFTVTNATPFSCPCTPRSLR